MENIQMSYISKIRFTFYGKQYFVWLYLLLFTSFLHGQSHWDQFRGPHRNGIVSAEEMTWVQPELLWAKEVGQGFSEVLIMDEKVYLLMAEKTDSLSGWESLLCMDAYTGEIIWTTHIDHLYIEEDEWGDGPRSTPAADNNTVFAFSASGTLAAVSRKNGDVLWKVDFVEDFGSTRPRWGYSSSPLLVDDMVIVEVGGKNEYGFVAFDKESGQVRWHRAMVNAAYNSPLAINVEGDNQIIFANGSLLYAFTSKGDSLWTYTMPIRSPMAIPVFIEPDMLFASAANDAGSFIIKINDHQPEELLRSSIMRNDWSSSVYHDGHIYGFNVATLQALDVETGRRKWLQRGFGKGSLIMVKDRLLVLSDQGEITMVKVTPESYNEILKFDALEGRSWTAPSFYNGNLYLRNHTGIVCYKIME